MWCWVLMVIISWITLVIANDDDDQLYSNHDDIVHVKKKFTDLIFCLADRSSRDHYTPLQQL